jgi:hypothetical protein
MSSTAQGYYYAQDLVIAAMREIGAIASNDAAGTSQPTQQELNDGLDLLNKLIDRSSMLGLLIMQMNESTQALDGRPSAVPYTINRPAKIRAAHCDAATISAPVEICSAEQWSQISDKSRAGKFCTKLFIDYQFPVSNFYVWPAANGTTLYLYYFVPLGRFPDLDSTQFQLPPGYASYLTLWLAMELAEQYGRPVTQSLLSDAQSARSEIMAANAAVFGTDPRPDQPQPQSPTKQTQQAA